MKLSGKKSNISGLTIINFQRNYFGLYFSSQYGRSLVVCGSNVVCRHLT